MNACAAVQRGAGAMMGALRRLLSLAVTVLAVSFVTFAAFDLLSGDVATEMLGTQATADSVAALRHQLGLDRPLTVRYGQWLMGFFTGDLGVSYQYRQGVAQLLGRKVQLTLCLGAVTFLLILAVSLPLGLLTAAPRHQGIHTAVNQLCMAVPPFFTGIVVSWCFGVVLRLFVPGSFPDLGSDPLGALRHLFFAGVCLALPRCAMTVRMLRSTVVSEMAKPYVRTAIARGADRGQVLWGHVLKNAAVPTVAFLGQTMAEIVAGSVVIEQVFAIPGLGRMLVGAISHRDYPVVQAIVVMLAVWVVLSGTVSDLICRRLDPRLERGAR